MDSLLGAIGRRKFESVIALSVFFAALSYAIIHPPFNVPTAGACLFLGAVVLFTGRDDS